MSGSGAVAGVPAASGADALRTARVFRYAVGSTLAMTVAMSFGWPLAYVTPVLSLNFLASPAPRFPLKLGLAFVALVTVACGGAIVLSRFLLSYPLVYVPFTALLLFRLVHAKTGGAPPAVITLMLITVLVLPFVALMSPAAVALTAGGLILGAAVTVLVVQLAYTMFPDPPGRTDARPHVAPRRIAPPEERFRVAAHSALIIIPVFVLFYTLQLSSAILVLVFTAMLSQQPGFGSNYKSGLALIVGNVMGGAAAILVYELLVLVPELPFLVLVTLLSGLAFGARVFSGGPRAPLFGMAYSTLLLIIGSTTSSGSEDAGAKMYQRVFQILIAVVYVVAASGTLERLWPSRRAAR